MTLMLEELALSNPCGKFCIDLLQMTNYPVRRLIGNQELIC
jgi:hypothetical protein